MPSQKATRTTITQT